MIDKLERLIEERGLNPTRLAGMAGVPQSTLYAVLKQGRKPTFEVIAAIAKVLDVSLDWLGDDAQDRPPPRITPEERVLVDSFRRSGLGVAEAIERFGWRPGEGYVGARPAVHPEDRGHRKVK